MRGYNYLDFANKPYYFGITLGYNTSSYKLVHAERFILNDSILVAESERGPGFNLGVVSNLKLGDDFDLRFLPTLSFADRRLTYTLADGSPAIKKIESVFIEAPFQFRYKSKPYKDVRAFVLVGAKYSFDLASNSRTRQAAQLVKVSPHDFLVEYGAGFQIYFPYFIFSPEFKVSHGVGNILIYDEDLIYTNTLEKIMSRVFTLSFHFEG